MSKTNKPVKYNAEMRKLIEIYGSVSKAKMIYNWRYGK